MIESWLFHAAKHGCRVYLVDGGWYAIDGLAVDL